jgi:hypothetical protein
MFLGLQDSDPYQLNRGTDQDPSLFSYVDRTKIMPAKYNFNTKFKKNFLGKEYDKPVSKLQRKKSFWILNEFRTKSEPDPLVSYGSGEPDPHHKFTDPQHCK